jgi:hypothetical protein
MLIFRVDVDYVFPSRLKSFVYTFFRWRSERDYLLFAKVLAKIFNRSKLDVKVYWFFSSYNFPDAEMLELLKSDRHEVGLHVINNPEKELRQLETVVNQKINYYTIHGTARLLGQIIWHRRLGQKQAKIPEGFRLQSFHSEDTYCLDDFCYRLTEEEATKAIKHFIAEDGIVEIHPEWLLQRGTFNHRGPYIKVLQNILH